MKLHPVFGLPVVVALVSCSGCKTTPPPDVDASASSATPTSSDAGSLEPRSGGSIVAAPARWKSLASTALLEAPPGELTLHAIDDTVVAYNAALVARTYVAGQTAPRSRLAPTGDVVAAKDVDGPFLIGVVDGKKIAGYSARTLEPKWSVDVDASQITSATANDKMAYVVITSGATNELLAIDAASSKIAWRAPAVPSTRVRLAGARIAIGDDGHAGALDATTGAKVWMEEMPGSRFVAASPTRIFTSGQRSRVFDVATGKASEPVTKISRTYTTSTIDGDAFFGLTAGTAATRVFAIDLVHAAEGWNVSHAHAIADKGPAMPTINLFAPSATIYGEGLLVDDDAVYVETRDGIVHAYERGDGKERAAISTFGGPGMAVLHAPDFALYLQGPGGIEIFKEGTPPSEHAEIDVLLTLDGKPVPQARVFISVLSVMSDAKGHAKTELDLTGDVRVLVEGNAPGGTADKPCTLIGEHAIRLDGTKKYTLELKATSSCAKPKPKPAPKK